MKELRSLYRKLELPNTRLVILDKNTGAGYIEDYNENVFARWGHMHEGIAVLSAYLEAFSRGFWQSEIG